MKPFDGIERTDQNVLFEVITGHSQETVTIILLLHTRTDHCTCTPSKAKQCSAVAQHSQAIQPTESQKHVYIFEEAETA